MSRYPVLDANTSYSKFRKFRCKDFRAALEAETGKQVGNMIFNFCDDLAHWRIIEEFRGFYTPDGLEYINISEEAQARIFNALTANAEPVGWFGK